MKVPRLELIAPRVWLLQIGLWRESDGVALVSDTAAARESIRRLAALRPRIVGVGHLGPMTGPGVVAELEAAAR